MPEALLWETKGQGGKETSSDCGCGVCRESSEAPISSLEPPAAKEPRSQLRGSNV